MLVRLAIARIVIGAFAILAPTLAARLFGFPPEHDNGTARAMGRLFGVRDIALGALALQFVDQPAVSARLHRVGAAVDAGDAGAALIALGRRDGIDRAALGLALVAGTATVVGIGIARGEEERAGRTSAAA